MGPSRGKARLPLLTIAMTRKRMLAAVVVVAAAGASPTAGHETVVRQQLWARGSRRLGGVASEAVW